ARVVDVVLNLDLAAQRLEDADKRIADRGVSEMPDVRGLIGIDIRVLDDRLAGKCLATNQSLGPGERVERAPKDGLAIEEEVHIAGSGELDFVNAGYRSKTPNQFLRHGARRLSEFFGEFEAKRRRQLAQIHFGRLVENNVFDFKIPKRPDRISQRFFDAQV